MTLDNLKSYLEERNNISFRYNFSEKDGAPSPESYYLESVPAEREMFLIFRGNKEGAEQLFNMFRQIDHSTVESRYDCDYEAIERALRKHGIKERVKQERLF